MNKKIFQVLWVVIALIAVASIVALIAMPHWKGIFLAGAGGFLILNLLIMIFFIKSNYGNRK